MARITVDTSCWKEFWDHWGDSIAKIPGMKEDLLAHIGARVQSEVKRAVELSGIHDPKGRIKYFQQQYIGSGKGYTAIRPESTMVPAGYKHMQVLNAGALTNFLSSGHKVRPPSGKSKRYVPRARMTRVRGHDFYKMAQSEAEKIAIQEAEEFLQRLFTTEMRP